MKQIFYLITLLLPAVCLFSCKEYQCTKADLRFGLIGFSDTEADTIILRRFDKTNATLPTDTFLLINIQFERRSDTLSMVAFSSNALMQSDYNYEVFIPQAVSLIKVTEVNEEQRSIKLGLMDKVGCVNFINTCKLNGQLNPVSSNDVYLRK